jgi:PKD repeat protein
MSRLIRSFTAVVAAVLAASVLGDAKARAEIGTTTDLASPTLTSPPSPSNDSTPTWTFRGEPGATFDCTLLKPFEGAWDGGGSGEDPPPPPVTIDHGSCDSGTYTFDLGLNAGGTYTLSVTQSDAAGNTSPAAEGSYYLDQTAYPPRILAGPDAVSSDSTPTWSFYGEYGASFTCTVTRAGSAVPVTVAPCTVSTSFMDQSYTADLTGSLDDAYTFSVVQTDTVGNASAPASWSFVLDRSTPNAPPVVTFTASCTQRDCKFDASGSSDADGWISTFSWDFGDGTGLVQAGQWTEAWHTFNVPSIYIVTLTATDDEGAGASTSMQVRILVNVPPSPAFTFSCSALHCSMDAGGSADPDGTIVSFAWSFGDGAAGSGRTAAHDYATAGGYTVTLTVTDNAGATAATSLRLNTINLSARGYRQNGQQKVDLAWTLLPGASFDVYRSGVRIATVQTAAYTDSVKKGSNTYAYKICAPALSTCSNVASVSF